jgi:hypothetical protein
MHCPKMEVSTPSHDRAVSEIQGKDLLFQVYLKGQKGWEKRV